MTAIHQWGVFEAELESVHDYENPFLDVAVRARFTGPSGKEQPVDAFWDGGRTWRVRFSPDEVGAWEWTSECTNKNDTGLHAGKGSFQCTEYEGDNPLYRHGPIRLSENRRHLTHTDGRAFFWLSDTAWNGVLRSKETPWNRYLELRGQQRFTAVQVVTTHWRGLSKDAHAESGFTHTTPIRLNPAFFRRLDGKIAAINAHGLVAAPVILWSLLPEDPGNVLSKSDAAAVGRYIVARWGAYSVVWFLAGDCRYHTQGPDRWRYIGRRIFGKHRKRLVTMHPCGCTWVGEDFRDEPWFDFVGYQSGHGDSEEHLRWLIEGPPARQWSDEPPRPVINLEPNYEMHPSYHGKKVFTDREVRRGAYWSLLVSPTAGVSYGNNPIWNWSEHPEVPEGHGGLGTVAPWGEGLNTPGLHSMTVMRKFFDSLPWWELRPAPKLLVTQPGQADPRQFVAAAMQEGGEFAVVYTPVGAEITLNSTLLAHPVFAQWSDPRKAEWGDPIKVEQPIQTFVAPDNNDWVLYLGKGR